MPPSRTPLRARPRSQAKVAASSNLAGLPPAQTSTVSKASWSPTRLSAITRPPFEAWAASPVTEMWRQR